MEISVNGIEMKYELSGRPEGPVVMMSHSLGSSMVMWGPQVPVLEQDYRLLRYDIRGHGGSEAPEGAYTLDLLGDDAVALIDALGIDRMIWIGLSLGGMIGQNLGLRYPERLVRLCLCDTAAIVPDEAQPVWRERIDSARKGGMHGLVGPTLERWFTSDFLKRNGEWVRIIRKQFLETPAAGFIGCAEAIRRLDYLDRLSAIRLPTLVLVGAEDPGTPVAAAEAISRRIPGSRLVIIPGAAHLSNIEQSEAFNGALISFLNEHA
jgi:3-oxoadipate enol-lactonase